MLCTEFACPLFVFLFHPHLTFCPITFHTSFSRPHIVNMCLHTCSLEIPIVAHSDNFQSVIVKWTGWNAKNCWVRWGTSNGKHFLREFFPAACHSYLTFLQGINPCSDHWLSLPLRLQPVLQQFLPESSAELELKPASR